MAFKCVHHKLAGRFYEQYPVIQKIAAVGDKLQLPEGARIHPIFHICLLKKLFGRSRGVLKELPPVTDEGAVILEPQQILDTRWVKRGNKIDEE